MSIEYKITVGLLIVTPRNPEDFLLFDDELLTDVSEMLQNLASRPAPTKNTIESIRFCKCNIGYLAECINDNGEIVNTAKPLNMFGALLLNNCSVKALEFEHCEIGLKNDITPLTQVLKENQKHLLFLNFQANNISRSNTILLANAVEKNTSIQSFIFKHHIWTEQPEATQTDYFEYTSQANLRITPDRSRLTLLPPTELSQESVRITTQQQSEKFPCALSFARMTNNHPSLKTLSLSDNHIAAPELILFLDNCLVIKTLQTLDLSHNHIDDAGLVKLIEMLKGNETIEELNLAFNEITDLGASLLLNFLESNTTLKTISLNDNHISPIIILQIEAALSPTMSGNLQPELNSVNEATNCNLPRYTRIQTVATGNPSATTPPARLSRTIASDSHLSRQIVSSCSVTNSNTLFATEKAPPSPSSSSTSEEVLYNNWVLLTLNNKNGGL